jgi:hypothetical protein
LGTTAQSSCRLGRIATFRPITAAAATMTPIATKSAGHCTRAATSATHDLRASGNSASSKDGTGGRPRGSRVPGYRMKKCVIGNMRIGINMRPYSDFLGFLAGDLVKVP